MPLTRERKETLIEDVRHLASESSALLLADFRGLDVAAMTDMRRRARAQSIRLKVVPNRLARLALEDTPHKCLQDTLTGPNLLVSTQEDAGALARLMREFMKDHEALAVRAVSVDGHRLAGDALHTIANLPSREQALSMLMGTLNAPVAKLAQVLTALPQKLVGTLDACARAKDAEHADGDSA